jgi:hypothetical protein
VSAATDAIDAAIEEQAAAGIQSASADGQLVSAIPLKDLLDARDRIAAREAAAQPHFGIRTVRLVPRGTV